MYNDALNIYFISSYITIEQKISQLLTDEDRSLTDCPSTVCLYHWASLHSIVRYKLSEMLHKARDKVKLGHLILGHLHHSVDIYNTWTLTPIG